MLTFTDIKRFGSDFSSLLLTAFHGLRCEVSVTIVTGNGQLETSKSLFFKVENTQFIILHHQETYQGEDKTTCQRTLLPLAAQRLYVLTLDYILPRQPTFNRGSQLSIPQHKSTLSKEAMTCLGST